MKIITVDAFTNIPFTGNPAAVCITDTPVEEALMQKVANELNLAETAFLYPKDKGFHLRWFTPEIEVRLCGHATLASAHVLFEQKFLRNTEKAVFYTLSGELSAEKTGDFIHLNFPRIKTTKKNADSDLLKALTEEVINSHYNEDGYWVFEVEDEEIVKKITPDMNVLRKYNSLIIVTGKSKSDDYDFVSRVFAPAYGINEDPVTGAAHCALASYWADKTRKTQFKAFQASKRGGFLGLALEEERVILTGQALSVSEIKLFI